jgi:hypothetical protein
VSKRDVPGLVFSGWMLQHVSRCAVAVPRAAFGSDASPRISAWCPNHFRAGQVVDKSLMSLMIVVEKAFRSSNGRLTGQCALIWGRGQLCYRMIGEMFQSEFHHAR